MIILTGKLHCWFASSSSAFSQGSSIIFPGDAFRMKFMKQQSGAARWELEVFQYNNVFWILSVLPQYCLVFFGGMEEKWKGGGVDIVESVFNNDKFCLFSQASIVPNFLVDLIVRQGYLLIIFLMLVLHVNLSRIVFRFHMVISISSSFIPTTRSLIFMSTTLNTRIFSLTVYKDEFLRVLNYDRTIK